MSIRSFFLHCFIEQSFWLFPVQFFTFESFSDSLIVQSTHFEFYVAVIIKGLAKLANIVCQTLPFPSKSGLTFVSMANDPNNGVCQAILSSFAKAEALIN